MSKRQELREKRLKERKNKRRQRTLYRLTMYCSYNNIPALLGNESCLSNSQRVIVVDGVNFMGGCLGIVLACNRCLQNQHIDSFMQGLANLSHKVWDKPFSNCAMRTSLIIIPFTIKKFPEEINFVDGDILATDDTLRKLSKVFPRRFPPLPGRLSHIIRRPRNPRRWR